MTHTTDHSRSTAPGPEAASAPALLLVHPFAVAAATAAFVAVARWVLAVALFSGLAGLAVAVVVVEGAYVALLSLITRATTGRARVGAALLVTVVLIAFAATVSLNQALLPAFGGFEALPISLAVAAGLASLVGLPGWTRLVGALALVVMLAVAAAPAASAEQQASEQQSAEDEAELAHRIATNTVPYVIPGLTTQIALPSAGQSEVRLSRDPDAPTHEGFTIEQSEILLTTYPVTAAQTPEDEACGWILIPDAGGSTSNTCEQLDDSTWRLAAGGESWVVRLEGDVRLEVRDPGATTAELVALLDSARPMPAKDFIDWNEWSFQRDQRV